MSDHGEEQCDCDNCSKLTPKEFKDAREVFTLELEGADISAILGCMGQMIDDHSDDEDIIGSLMVLHQTLGMQTVGSPLVAFAKGEYNEVVMNAIGHVGHALASAALETGLQTPEDMAEGMGAAMGELDALKAKAGDS